MITKRLVKFEIIFQLFSLDRKELSHEFIISYYQWVSRPELASETQMAQSRNFKPSKFSVLFTILIYILWRWQYKTAVDELLHRVIVP